MIDTDEFPSWDRHELDEGFGEDNDYVPDSNDFVGKTIESIDAYENVSSDGEQVEGVLVINFTNNSAVKITATDTVSERYCSALRYEIEKE